MFFDWFLLSYLLRVFRPYAIWLLRYHVFDLIPWSPDVCHVLLMLVNLVDRSLYVCKSGQHLFNAVWLRCVNVFCIWEASKETQIKPALNVYGLYRPVSKGSPLSETAECPAPSYPPATSLPTGSMHSHPAAVRDSLRPQYSRVGNAKFMCDLYSIWYMIYDIHIYQIMLKRWMWRWSPF